MATNVRRYTDNELLERVKSLPSFTSIPEDYWIIGVQSLEDAYNVYDDKFYLYKGEEFIMTTTGTTNSGEKGIKNFDDYGRIGVAVIKTDEWYYNLWSYGLHRGKMRSLKQVNKIKFYRDSDKDEKVEEQGELFEEIIGINFHTMHYYMDYVRKTVINGWSEGCQVINDTRDYHKIIDLTEKQDFVSYVLLKEF